MRDSKFEIYKDKAGEWRFRFVAGNGETIAASGEGYVSKIGCLNAVAMIQQRAAGALIDSLENDKKIISDEVATKEKPKLNVAAEEPIEEIAEEPKKSKRKLRKRK